LSRVLISVGCNSYDDGRFCGLSGAEADAAAIFERLVTQKLGQFEDARSKLLLSPSLEDVRSAIADALFKGDPIDCLTVFYAGHGGVKDSTYFLMCRDSNLDQLSLSSISMSSLFSHINEARCAHTNIIIDACQSGGVVHDIGSLLKPDIIGKSGAISVSILAAAASNQTAAENNGQGACTSALLDCIDGKIEIPTRRSTLDLFDIGQILSPKLSLESNQNPEYWGISLKGHVPLCINPNAAGDAQPKLNVDFGTGLPPEVQSLVDGQADNIWKQYFAFEGAEENEELLDVLRNCVSALEGYPLEAVDFAYGVSSAFRQKLSTPRSGFEEAELIGVAVTAIAHLAGMNDQVDSAISKMCDEIAEMVAKGVTDLNSMMTREKYSLLSTGYSEFYFLPIRISKILGWIGATAQITRLRKFEFPGGAVKQLLAKLIEDYSRSIYSVSDIQAPNLASFVSAAEGSNFRDEAETLTCFMFSSYHEVRGRIASTDIANDQIIKFLISTTGAEADGLDRAAIAQPSELLSLFFVLYSKFGMADVLDESLADLDHQHFNIFVPDHYTRFGDDLIREGQNYTFQVGHGIWTTSDFATRWADIRTHLAKIDDVKSPIIATCALICSLVIPDRTPWFLFSDIEI
jgi:Caspase domain